jgi:hypothetical protein
MIWCAMNVKRLKSQITMTAGAGYDSPCDVYYDESGNLHVHDRSWYPIYYKCSNGHEWEANSVKVPF